MCQHKAKYPLNIPINVLSPFSMSYVLIQADNELPYVNKSFPRSSKSRTVNPTSLTIRILLTLIHKTLSIIRLTITCTQCIGAIRTDL